ncbi:MAG: hypothetical protein INH11_13500 [Gemmatimonas sp.]|nr:hypothetical protein [Gemmatimonas sp.]
MFHDPLKVRCRYALLCDHFSITFDGKPIITGAFESIYVCRQPNGEIIVRHGVLTLRLEAAIACGSHHTFRIDLVDEHGKSFSNFPDQPIELRAGTEGLPMQMIFSMALESIKVPEFGYYCWNVVVDGEVVAECPMLVQELRA